MNLEESQKIDKGGKRGKKVSAYAIADDLEIMEKRGEKIDPGQAGWVAGMLRIQSII